MLHMLYVYHDMKSHIGAGLSLGIGAIMSLLCKYKLVTKSSTDAKLIGVDNVMSFVMWAKYFFEEQTAELSENSKLNKESWKTQFD